MTADGRRLGTVKDVAGSYLQVDAQRRRDYWLSGEHVERMTADAVTLRFRYRDLAQFRLSEPGLEPSQDPLREIAGKPVLTDVEQLEQRRRMEMELAGQREQLPHRDSGEASSPDTFGTVGEPVESELARTAGEQPAVQPSPGERAAASPTGAVVGTDQEAEDARRAGLYWPRGERPQPGEPGSRAGLPEPDLTPLGLMLAALGLLVMLPLLGRLVRLVPPFRGKR